MPRYRFCLVNGHDGLIEIPGSEALDSGGWIKTTDGREVRVSAVVELWLVEDGPTETGELQAAQLEKIKRMTEPDAP